MEEAEFLSDRIMILHEGKIKCIGTTKAKHLKQLKHIKHLEHFKSQMLQMFSII